jgi:hypothetical protein
MITAHRNTRHFNLPISRRSFNVDAYLNQQLALQAEERRLNALESATDPALPIEVSRFRNWAVRLNNRIESWLDRTDFRAIELKVERIFLPLAFTGIALYLLVNVADAFVSGAVAAAVK